MKKGFGSTAIILVAAVAVMAIFAGVPQAVMGAFNQVTGVVLHCDVDPMNSNCFCDVGDRKAPLGTNIPGVLRNVCWVVPAASQDSQMITSAKNNIGTKYPACDSVTCSSTLGGLTNTVNVIYGTFGSVDYARVECVGYDNIDPTKNTKWWETYVDKNNGAEFNNPSTWHITSCTDTAGTLYQG